MMNEVLWRTCFAYQMPASGRLLHYEFEDAIAKGVEAQENAAEKKEADEKPKADSESASEATDETKKRGDVMIEAAARIPIPSSSEEPGKVEDKLTAGGEVVARYVLTDPNEAYLAMTFPLTGKYVSSEVVTMGEAVESTLADTVTVTGGVGLEAGVPLGDVVTLYGGAGVEGGVQVYDYVSASSEGRASEGTEVNPTFAAYGTAGLRVNPTTNWHIYSAVKPTVTFTDGPGLDVPVHVGTGFSF